MADFAKAPNSCELTKTINRGWQMQVKPKGTAETEYKFVPGAQSIAPSVTKNSVDATDLASDGWSSEVGTSRELNIAAVIQFVERGGLQLLDPVQHMLKIAGEETGAAEQLDVRVWRDDIDEGWEATFTTKWTENGGDANALRTANVDFKSSCAPTRIHSVVAGSETAESVPLTPEELATLASGNPAPAPAPTEGGA